LRTISGGQAALMLAAVLQVVSLPTFYQAGILFARCQWDKKHDKTLHGYQSCAAHFEFFCLIVFLKVFLKSFLNYVLVLLFLFFYPER
jgi:hypothetical protein